jgi:hypothetical protein
MRLSIPDHASATSPVHPRHRDKPSRTALRLRDSPVRPTSDHALVTTHCLPTHRDNPPRPAPPLCDSPPRASPDRSDNPVRNVPALARATCLSLSNHVNATLRPSPIPSAATSHAEPAHPTATYCSTPPRTIRSFATNGENVDELLPGTQIEDPSTGRSGTVITCREWRGDVLVRGRDGETFAILIEDVTVSREQFELEPNEQLRF